MAPIWVIDNSFMVKDPFYPNFYVKEKKTAFEQLIQIEVPEVATNFITIKWKVFMFPDNEPAVKNPPMNLGFL